MLVEELLDFSLGDDLYAMEKIYKAGGFGKIIYSEGEYDHTKEPGAPSYPSYNDWRKNQIEREYNKAKAIVDAYEELKATGKW